MCTLLGCRTIPCIEDVGCRAQPISSTRRHRRARRHSIVPRPHESCQQSSKGCPAVQQKRSCRASPSMTRRQLNGMHERRARLPKRAYLLPRLLSRDEATLVRRLAESDPTAQFARDPDTVDRLPTFECAVFDSGRPVATAVCRVLEPVVTERLLPYLRKRFDCSSLELSQALIRRYLPTERREHPAHFDAHATATVVVSLCDPEDYVGGYYAQPTADAASARYASLEVGDAFCHGHDLRHGVRVFSGARYSSGIVVHAACAPVST